MSLAARITSFAQRDAPVTIGIALSVVWLLLIGLFRLLAPGEDGSTGGVARLMAVMGAILPLVLIWMAVMLARAIAALREEAEDLRARLGQLRDMAATRGAPPPINRPQVEPQSRPEPLRPAQPAPVQPAPVHPGVIRPRPAPDGRQAAMRFDAPESIAVPPETLILALNFPDGPGDAEGVAALRAALRDHDSSRVLRAAQDVVTLLAGQGLYMDDLPPDPASPTVWRRFAEGGRGSAVAQLGGIHDETALAVTSDLMRQDEIFRDTAHHFLRHFDNALAKLVSELDDAQIAVLAQTRSARAFMLLGRAAGIFG